MKAEELMLFDLVKRKKDGKVMTVVELRYAETIAAITPEDVYYGDTEDYHESEIDPIPLTPEILEKNFPKADTVDWWPCGEDGYKFYIVVKGKETTIMGKMSDLHLLQHALKLCGINLEIKL